MPKMAQVYLSTLSAGKFERRNQVTIPSHHYNGIYNVPKCQSRNIKPVGNT